MRPGRRLRHHRRWGPPHGWQGWENATPEQRHWWRRNRRRMFWRFMATFSMILLPVVGGMAVLAWLLTRWVGGNGSTAVLVWLVGLSLSIALPVLAFSMARRAFRGFATPIADVMSAADAVAEGDLSTRVADTYRGDFGRLARSFNRMAQELELSDQRRRNLTADVAHELRTPLHIIQGNLEGILDEVYEPTPDHIEATLAETRLLARLIDDLRTLSLAEAGQLPLTLETVDVAELLADVDTSFSGQAEAAGIAFSVMSPAGLQVEADYGRLTQVINNLVINALRHTPAGGEVHINAKPLDQQVAIAVCDTGEGIAADALPYIFDRFWRGDKARTHTAGSSGLGLAIASQLIKSHHGTIKVESETGKGTTFTIWLPLV